MDTRDRFTHACSWAICALCCLYHTPDLGAQTPAEWQAAARAVRRLPPDSFPELPAAIRAALAARQCRVPQSFTSARPHNVIGGRFARPGQHDWAILCSHQDSSSILIFWGNEQASQSIEFARASDAGFLQGIGEGRIGYSRIVTVASSARIREYAVSFGGSLPSVLDHDGLEDSFAGKASTVSYWVGNRRLVLTGAD
jgi:hypothetical protein